MGWEAQIVTALTKKPALARDRFENAEHFLPVGCNFPRRC